MIATKGTSSVQRWLSMIVCLTSVFAIGSQLGTGNNRSDATQTADNCIACHSKQGGASGQAVTLYRTSTHGHASIGCDGCHGGDSSQIEKSKAHAGGFVARPDTASTLDMCGKCHRQPLEFFKSSKHVAARPNVARLDCVECHGVHAIGAYSESFRWPQFCAGCHGLEYLPQLPKPFQEMLAMADELNEGLHRLESTGSVSAELTRQRREIRHAISELVHRTDAKGGVERIPQILELSSALKVRIKTEQKR